MCSFMSDVDDKPIKRMIFERIRHETFSKLSTQSFYTLF